MNECMNKASPADVACTLKISNLKNQGNPQRSKQRHGRSLVGSTPWQRCSKIGRNPVQIQIGRSGYPPEHACML